MGQDRIALVTGAGRGIGRATALRLASAGVTVMGVARSQEELAEVSALSPRIHHLAESLATPEGCARVVAETESRLGRIDILVNNAGLGSAHERPIWDQDPQMWRETMAINLDAPFHLTRLAVRGMRERGWGRIVMVSSTAGEVAGPSESAYDASKHGVIGLMRAVAQDVAPHGITCNAVLPGWVRTRMADISGKTEAARRGVSLEQVWRERDSSYPAGRVPTAEEVAELIAFLAGDASSGISGQAIKVTLGGVW